VGDDLFDVQTRQTVPPGTLSQPADVGDGQGPCARCRRRTRFIALHRRLPVIGPAARPAVRTARMTYSTCRLGFTSADCTHGVVSANLSRAAGKYGGSGQLLMECVSPRQDDHQGRAAAVAPVPSPGSGPAGRRPAASKPADAHTGCSATSGPFARSKIALTCPLLTGSSVSVFAARGWQNSRSWAFLESSNRSAKRVCTWVTSRKDSAHRLGYR
jgi:hypothetical protein